MGGVLMSVFGKKALSETRKLGDEKANKKQEEWITPTLLNGWVKEFETFQYMKDEMGFVHFRGGAKGGEDMPFFTLPASYRPKKNTYFKPLHPVDTSLRNLVIRTSGNMSSYGVTFFREGMSFEGLTYYAGSD